MANRYTTYSQPIFSPLSFQELSIAPSMMYKMHQEAIANAMEIDEKSIAKSLPFDNPEVSGIIGEIKNEASSIISDIRDKGVKESDAVSRVMALKKKYNYEFSQGTVYYAEQAYKKKIEIDEEIDKLARDPKNQITPQRASYLKYRNYLDYVMRGGATNKATYNFLTPSLLDAPLVEKIDKIFDGIQADKLPIKLRIRPDGFYEYGSEEKLSPKRVYSIITSYLESDPMIMNYVKEEAESLSYNLPETFTIKLKEKDKNGEVEKEITRDQYKEMLRQNILTNAISTVLAKRSFSKLDIKYSTLPSHYFKINGDDNVLTSTATDIFTLLDFKNESRFKKSLEELKQSDSNAFESAIGYLSQFSDQVYDGFKKHNDDIFMNNSISKLNILDSHEFINKIYPDIFNLFLRNTKLTRKDVNDLIESKKDLMSDKLRQHFEKSGKNDYGFFTDAILSYQSKFFSNFYGNILSRIKEQDKSKDSLTYPARTYEVAFNSDIRSKIGNFASDIFNLGSHYIINERNEFVKQKLPENASDIKMIGFISRGDYGRPLIKVQYKVKKNNEYETKTSYIDIDPSNSLTTLNNQMENIFKILANSSDKNTSDAARRLTFEYYSSTYSPLNKVFSRSNREAVNVMNNFYGIFNRYPVNNSLIEKSRTGFIVKINNKPISSLDIFSKMIKELKITNLSNQEQIEHVNSFLNLMGLKSIDLNNLGSTYEFESSFDAYNFLTSFEND